MADLPSDPTWLTAPWTRVRFAELGEEFGWERGQNDRGAYAHKPYLIAFADQRKFFQDLRGVSGLSSANHGNWIWTGPLLYPDFPEDNIYCTGISVKSAGAIVGSMPIQYTYVIVLVTFTPLTWDAQQQDSDPFGLNSFGETAEEIQALATASQEMDFAYQEVPIPQSALKFGDGTRSTIPATQRVSLTTMLITWERLPYLPMPEVRNMAGSVNSSTFLGAPAGQVRFDGARSSRQQQADGTVTQRVQMTFVYRSKPFNQIPRPDTGLFDTVYKPDGSTILESNDFSQLLF